MQEINCVLRLQIILIIYFLILIELHGDRCYGDDGAVSGIGMFHNILLLWYRAKGKSTEENIKRKFWNGNHERGYRKVMRIAKQAEKFNRPIITFVDTAGAYPGEEAEERGQAEAIAKCLFEFSSLETVIICVVIGERRKRRCFGTQCRRLCCNA